MKYCFTDKKDNIWFEFHEQLPTNKEQNAFNVNIAALTLYGMYRTTVYESYGTKPDLAQDIKTFNQNPEHLKNGRVIHPEDSLYNYSIYGAMLGIKKLLSQAQSYIAYQKNQQGWPEKVGFVSFYRGKVDGRDVVYIADAGVKFRGQSIGRRLMECVLTHFDPGTEFYILTRKFNTEAVNLYQDKLGFKSISLAEIKQLDYDDRYVGFNHTTTQLELNSIHKKKKEYLGEQKQTKSLFDATKHQPQDDGKHNSNMINGFVLSHKSTAQSKLLEDESMDSRDDQQNIISGKKKVMKS